MTDDPINLGGDRSLTWLQRVVKRLGGQRRGDVIVAKLGGRNSHIIVGKNIIQVGTVTIPGWALVLVTVVVTAGVGIGIGIGVKLLGDVGRLLGATERVTSMPPGHFNIAVAQFDATDDHDHLLDIPEAVEIPKGIASYLAIQKDALAQSRGEAVEVWGPDQGIAPIEPGTESTRAAALNAHVLMYGRLRVTESQPWTITPLFYLSDRAIGHAYELYGEYALGSAIPYRPGISGPASRSDVNETLTLRLEALSRMLRGLSYMTYGDLDGYRRAADTFQRIISDTEWGKASNGTGQEILYLFLGNAFLSQSFLTDDAAPEREELLVQSRNAYSTAISLNPNYARSYNGLGSTLFQMARPLITEHECEDWQWNLLDESRHHFETALELPAETKPASGRVDYRAHFGLGRVFFVQGYCLDAQQWEGAQRHYQQVIDEYEHLEDPLADLTEIASYAHTDLGTMSFLQADLYLAQETQNEVEKGKKLLGESVAHYRQAFELATTSGTEVGGKHAIGAMPYYISALCLNGQREDASMVLDRLAAEVDDSDAVRSEILSLVDTSLWEDCNNANTKE